jgi:hypothetical protein
LPSALCLRPLPSAPSPLPSQAPPATPSPSSAPLLLTSLTSPHSPRLTQPTLSFSTPLSPRCSAHTPTLSHTHTPSCSRFVRYYHSLPRLKPCFRLCFSRHAKPSTYSQSYTRQSSVSLTLSGPPSPIPSRPSFPNLLLALLGAGLPLAAHTPKLPTVRVPLLAARLGRPESSSPAIQLVFARSQTPPGGSAHRRGAPTRHLESQRHSRHSRHSRHPRRAAPRSACYPSTTPEESLLCLQFSFFARPLPLLLPRLPNPTRGLITNTPRFITSIRSTYPPTSYAGRCTPYLPHCTLHAVSCTLLAVSCTLNAARRIVHAVLPNGQCPSPAAPPPSTPHPYTPHPYMPHPSGSEPTSLRLPLSPFLRTSSTSLSITPHPPHFPAYHSPSGSLPPTMP